MLTYDLQHARFTLKNRLALVWLIYALQCETCFGLTVKNTTAATAK